MLDSGFIGFSLSSFENDYGVPGEHAEGDTLIEMESDRFELRSGIEISDSGLLTGIDLNFGFGDYQHSESGFETENNKTEWHTHATYLREGFEGKIAFRHEIGNLSGFGIHGLLMNSGVGEESIFVTEHGQIFW